MHNARRSARWPLAALANLLLLPCSNAWPVPPKPGSAAALRFQSGPDQVALIELYTSEGCSSCPPADAWLAGLAADPGLWRRFVPMGFHVDYWDGLGWRDRLADPAWTRRQYGHARDGNVGTVYTPGVLRNGREWRRSPGAAPAPDLAVKAGTLHASLEDGIAEVRFEPAIPGTEPPTAHVALLASGLTTAVVRGENAGRQLNHGFVVLGLASAALGPAGTRIRLPVATIPAPRRAMAVWVTAGASLRPLQATGGWLAPERPAGGPAAAYAAKPPSMSRLAPVR